jgi:adenylate kinase
MLYVILFGPPGSGKGTQSEKIIEKYNLVHISTGDLLRNPTDGGVELGKLVQEYVNNGNLAPDDLVIRMVENKIKANTKSKGFIFDGFPRTVAQAKALDEMLENRNAKISIMLALEVDDDEIHSRIHLRGKTSGRADDQNDEKINHRISVYKKVTLPVAKYYNKQSKYKGINGVGDIDGIFNDICMSIDLIKITN